MNNKLEQAILEEKRAYFKNWRANNKDKVKKNNAEYWRRKALQRISQNSSTSEKEEN